MTNHSIYLRQVPWWLPTTCALPKSASLPTATAATVATTRTSVTSSQSFSQRTPASVSCTSAQLSDQLFLILFPSTLFLLYFISFSDFCLIFCFHPLCSAGLFPVLFSYPLFLSLLLSVSPSNQIYPIAMLALLSFHIIVQPVILCGCVCVRLCAQKL